MNVSYIKKSKILTIKIIIYKYQLKHNNILFIVINVFKIRKPKILTTKIIPPRIRVSL